MTHQLAAFVVTHDESVLGQLIFPKLSAVVKQNAGKQKIDIQLWIERRHLICDAHHLRGVFDETAAARVMIIARRSRTPETIAPFAQKCFAEGAQARIDNRFHRLRDEIRIRFLFRP